MAEIDYDVTETEELMPEMHKAAVELARKGWYDMATTVDTAATRMRIMQDDLEDVRAELVELTQAFHRVRSERDELSEQVRRLENERDDAVHTLGFTEDECDRLRDETYYLQDRLDEAHRELLEAENQEGWR